MRSETPGQFNCMVKWLGGVLWVLVSACRSPSLPSAPPLQLTAPERADFGQVEVGSRRTLEVRFSNSSERPAELTAGVEPPFFVGTSRFVLAARSVGSLEVTVAPVSQGKLEAVLRVGASSVQLSATAVRPPGADELKACRVACDAGQCSANEGALCAASACSSRTASVCREGRCVEVPRPTLNRCTGRWLSDNPLGPASFGPDERRGRVVRFDSRGDTWEWDGARWHQRFPPATPPPRAEGLMTWEPLQQQVLLFGGRRANRWLTDLWAWDGTNWLERQARARPPPTTQRHLGWDEQGQEVVLVTEPSPASFEQWRWKGSTWQRAPVRDGGPGDLRFSTSGARSPEPFATPVTLVALGRDQFAFGDDSVWVRLGVSWSNRTHLLATQPRRDQAVVWDPFHERGVLFGGQSQQRLGDTWHWDGSGWALLSPAKAPPPRSGHALVWDAVRRRVVLFGGRSDTGLLSDTWEWNAAPREQSALGGRTCGIDADGLTWTRADAVQAPPAREHHALAWDAARQRVVLFGGSSDGGLLGDTWTWTGVTWEQHRQPQPPGPRERPALAWHPGSQRVVLFGGLGPAGALADTWTWDGSTWTALAGAPAKACEAPSLAWDQSRLRLMLTCGAGGVWALAGQGWALVQEETPRDLTTFWDGTSRQLIGFDGRVTWRLVLDEPAQLTPAPAPR